MPVSIGGAAQWFGPAAYPAAAIRIHAKGRTVATLAINAQGRVTDCVVASSRESADLDAATCDIAPRRMAFQPGHDPSGRSIAGHYTLPIRWQLPTTPPAANVATTLV